ncbi:MAG: FecR family protein [Prolixibacteraceae bacterium]
MSQLIIEKILSGTATPTEKKQFDVWLNGSADNRAYFNKTRVVWDGLDHSFSTKKFDKSAAQLKINAKISASTIRTVRLKRRRQTAVAATFLVLILFSLFVGKQFIHNNQFSKIYTASDSVIELKLEDGTHVWLNKSSTLKLPENFSRKDRTVNLKGEAYFEVQHHESKPFRVLTGKTITNVLGTSFNLELDTISGNVNLNVTSGKVAFYKKYKSGQYDLTVGAFAQYLESENRILVSKNASQNYLAWKTGVLKFYDTPIQQVCADLSKFYGKQISTNLKNECILTGTFDHEELENVLSVIQLSLGVKMNEENGVFVLRK